MVVGCVEYEWRWGVWGEFLEGSYIVLGVWVVE